MEDNKLEVTFAPLSAPRFKEAIYELREWVVNAPEKVTIEDVQRPEFWSHVAPKMRPYDEIRVRAEDGTWYARLLVTGTDRTWARVAVLEYKKLTTYDVSQTQSARFELRLRGPQHKWCVIRLLDNQVIKSECQTRDEAAMWLREYEKTL